MKNIYAILAVVAMLFVACEPAVEGPGGQENEESQLKLTTSDAVSVGSGNAMGFIKYEILESVEGAEVKAEADVDWICDFDYSSTGQIGYSVKANPDAEPRTGVITVSYDKSSFTVTVTQKLSENPTNEYITATYLEGKYYGNYAGLQDGMYNYYVVFSDLGMNMDPTATDNFTTPNAYYYLVDLYLDTPPTDLNNIVVPNGVYEYDITNSGFMNTFTESCSWYRRVDASGFAMPEYEVHYDKGTLTVEDGKVTLEITLEIDHMQKTHIVTYEGAHSLVDCTNEAY